MVGEEWRDIPGYEELYQISSLGRLKAKTDSNKRKAGSIIKAHPNRHGRYSVYLWKNKIRKPFLRYKLVALVFLGPCPEGHEVDHKNENSSDDRAENLQYLTRLENVRKALASGSMKIEERHYRARLSREQVGEIKRMLRDGVQQKKIAQMFKIAPGGISSIKAGHCWKSVE